MRPLQRGTLVVALAVLLAGCGSTTMPPAPTASPAATRPAPAASPAPPSIAAAQHDLGLLGHPVPATGVLDPATRASLEVVTSKYGWAYDGTLTPDLARRLHGYAGRAAQAPPQCRAAVPRLLCVDERLLLLLVLERGRVVQRLDVRLSGNPDTDRAGSFRVYRKVERLRSVEFDTVMVDALFFDAGRAVHYSPGFARAGYAGRSKGCVNIRDRAAMDALFRSTRRGDRVEVVPATTR